MCVTQTCTGTHAITTQLVPQQPHYICLYLQVRRAVGYVGGVTLDSIEGDASVDITVINVMNNPLPGLDPEGPAEGSQGVNYDFEDGLSPKKLSFTGMPC